MRNCVFPGCGVEFEAKGRAKRCEEHRTRAARVKQAQIELRESTALKVAGIGRKPKNKGAKAEPRFPVVAGALYYHRFDR